MVRVIIVYDDEDTPKVDGEFDCLMMVARRKECRGYAVFGSIPDDELTEAMAVFNYQVVKELESRDMIKGVIPLIEKEGE